ncbi:hypothetical protein ANH9381_0042 [Aggregatibacter actinomycetemcomitans ANH9381]|nr:hypothetical protein ANH9381_0042 [Aggregatibacter actinomycetemcomitans ANH9381]
MWCAWKITSEQGANNSWFITTPRKLTFEGFSFQPNEPKTQNRDFIRQILFF